MEDEKYLDPVFLKYGRKVYTHDHIEDLRKKKSKKDIIPQKGGQEMLLTSEANIIFYGGVRGGGKCLNINELICTPFGFRRIGDLKPNDIITGLDGGMQRVVYNYNNGIKKIYRLKFIDGSTVECSLDHLWNIKKTNRSRKKRKLYNLDRKSDWTVWSTKKIIDALDIKDSGSLKSTYHLMIPLCEPVRFTKAIGRSYKPKFDPYIIGALIGDGSISELNITNKCVCLESMDDEVVQQFTNAGIDMTHFTSYDYKKSRCYRITNTDLIEELQQLGIAGHKSYTKFIPKYYLYGSLDDRFSLIQGLMDTDGTIDSRGHCSFSTVSEQLAKDVKFMINSLGGIATITKSKSGYKKDGIYIECSDCYDVYIRLKDSYRLFRLARKKERSKVYNGGISEYGRRIVGYEYVGEKEVCCIAVSNTDSLYLTNDFIVTHNSAGLLMNGYKYIENPHFLGSIFRKEINDAKRSGSIVDQSNFFYKDFGVYNKSSQDMTWNFSNGGKLNFGYYSDSFDGFTTRYRGMQIAYIGIDEVTQIPYTYFKFLLTCNRNAQGLENKIIGTCNPDPDSWVARFIGGTYSNKIGEDGIEKCRYKWIGEDGYPIEEMNGKILYCYMWGDREDQVYWGETKEEVYEQAKDKIDAMWTPELEQFGNKLDMFIFSVTFIIGRLEENKILLESDPSYFKNLAQQSEEQRMRDLKGNWKFKSSGDGLISRDQLEAIFKNSQQRSDYRCVTADIAFDGGDLAVLFYWEGFHAMAVEVFKVNAQLLLSNIKNFLDKYAVPEECFCYDATGLGKYLEGFMPKAHPFFTNASPTDKKEVQFGNVKQMISNYENLKAQCIDLCCDRIKLQGYSFDGLLLGRRILGKMLIDHLREEYVSFRRDNKNIDGKFKIMPKAEAIAIIGHSPNFIDALYIREYLEIIRTSKKVIKRIGAYYL